MSKLKLRFPPAVVLSAEPSLPVPPAAAPPAVLLLRRREFLKAIAAVLVALATPVTSFQRAYAAARGRFFTRHEFATLEALCDRIIPPDADPGGKALGAAAYIERLLTAFDHHVPLIYAGGPFSNRNPFPDNADGTPSRRRPRNAFRHFIPLTRLQELRWRAEIFGSEKLYAGKTDPTSMALRALDDAQGGPLIGLRDLYRDALGKADQVAQATGGAPFIALTPAQQDAVLSAMDLDLVRFPVDPRRGDTFVTLLIRHTLEGCFSDPEYGGNKGTAGWKMIRLEGDDQPLGFSIFSRAKDDYNERPDHPMSTPNPDELNPDGTVKAKPLTPDGTAVLTSIGLISGVFNRCEVS